MVEPNDSHVANATPSHAEAAGYLRVRLKRFIIVAPVLLLVALLMAGVGYAYEARQPKRYESAAALIVGPALRSAAVDPNRLAASEHLAATYASVATTRPVLERAAARAGIPVASLDLDKDVWVVQSEGTGLLHIHAKTSTASSAALMANAVADELIAISPSLPDATNSVGGTIDEQLDFTRSRIDEIRQGLQAVLSVSERTRAQDARLLELQGEYSSLLGTYANLVPLSSLNAPNVVDVVEPAIAPQGPSEPRPLIFSLLAGALGFLFACLVLFIPKLWDDKIRRPEDIPMSSGVDFVVVLPRKSRWRDRVRSVLPGRTAPADEGLRPLRLSIERAPTTNPIRTVQVTSPRQAADKTGVAVNLALSFAQTGRKVLLIDGDMRDPRIHKVFDVPNDRGLATVLSDGPSSAWLPIHQSTQARLLGILPAGSAPGDPADLLDSPNTHPLFEQLKQRADILVVDSPPMSAGTEARLLCAQADATLVVLIAGSSRAADLQEITRLLDGVGTSRIGAVIVQGRRRWPTGLSKRSRRSSNQGKGAESSASAVQEPSHHAAPTAEAEPGPYALTTNAHQAERSAGSSR